MAFAKPNKNTKSKLQVSTYEKKFETFAELQEELKGISPVIAEIFPYEDDSITAFTMADDLLNYFKNNAPDVINRKNIASSLSISSNRVSLKTNKFFTLQWQFKYDDNGFVTDLSARIVTFVKDNKVSKHVEEIVNHLTSEENNWTFVEFNK